MRLKVSQDDGEASTSDASSTTITKRRHTRKLKLVPALFVVVALGLALQGAFAQSASAETGVPCPQTGMETVATDAPDYPPGSTVHITGTGYAPGCDATVQISRPDSVVESFTASTDLDGNLAYDYLLPPPPGVIGEYGLDILGLNGVLASMTFTDAPRTWTAQQARNGISRATGQGAIPELGRRCHHSGKRRERSLSSREHCRGECQNGHLGDGRGNAALPDRVGEHADHRQRGPERRRGTVTHTGGTIVANNGVVSITGPD